MIVPIHCRVIIPGRPYAPNLGHNTGPLILTSVFTVHVIFKEIIIALFLFFLSLPLSFLSSHYLSVPPSLSLFPLLRLTPYMCVLV